MLLFLLRLSPGLPLLSSSSGDPTLRRVGSLVLAGTEVLFSIPPGKIWNTVLPFQGSVTFDAGGSEETPVIFMSNTLFPWRTR